MNSSYSLNPVCPNLIQINSPREHSAILSAFIKLPFVFKTFVLSIFEWPFKTGFTVLNEFGRRKYSASSRAFYLFFPNKLNKFNNTGARMFHFIYHMTLKLL